jgi:hypothetical protein
MDTIFDLCVRVLQVLANFFGTTYKAINVWIFVIIWPLFTLYLIITVISQHKKVNKMKARLADKKVNVG